MKMIFLPSSKIATCLTIAKYGQSHFGDNVLGYQLIGLLYPADLKAVKWKSGKISDNWHFFRVNEARGSQSY